MSYLSRKISIKKVIILEEVTTVGRNWKGNLSKRKLIVPNFSTVLINNFLTFSNAQVEEQKNSTNIRK